MLLQIALKNFFSLRDEAVLDLRATASRKPEFRRNAISEGGTNLLKSVAIFGANASGKSNLLRAIEICLQYVHESHNYTESTAPRFEPFKFHNASQPSSFAMEFVIDGERYEFGFSIMSGKITEEYLYSYPKRYRALIYRRTMDKGNEYTYSFSKKFTRPKEVAANTSAQTLFLTRAALMNRTEASKVFQYISNRVVVGLPAFNNSAFEELLLNHKDTMLHALRYADSDIVDYELKTDPQGKGAKRLITYHKGNPTKPFDFEREESAGTRRLLRLIASFIDVADHGKILILDELETSLHPQLVTYAVKLFNHSDKGQMIFSTHDLDLLNTNILRPDQIYFTSKDYDTGASELYSLSDFTDYKDYKNLRRDYEQGRFDAIPILPSL